jgi:hypothetical protein
VQSGKTIPTFRWKNRKTEDNIDDIKDRFYEEQEHVFDKFPK